MIHGFPDYWYTWRNQMDAVASSHQVVAIDMRGYNKSDKPEGVDNYSLDKLVGDVRAVVEHFRRDKVTVVGHDWGGMVAWAFAAQFPKMTERLVILNLPHPNGLRRELANNPQQRKNSQYARNFQQEGAEQQLSPKMLSLWVKDANARVKYEEAFGRSSITAMLNYYRANYPKPPYDKARQPALPRIKCPVLMFHGLKDKYLLPGALNDTWKWIDGELTLITIPGAGHFVQHDAAQRVTKRMVQWLED